jgi:quinol monooxygenase YgiN
MPPKTKKKRKTQKSGGLEVSAEATKILRTVRDEEAFYFYEAIGKPTEENARSLSDFLEKIKSVRLESLLFHLQRRDFQTWMKKILGDSKLARKMDRISPSHDDDLRIKIHATVENRIKELRDASLTLLVSEDLAVVSSGFTS